MDAVLASSQPSRATVATGDPDMDTVLSAKGDATSPPVENTWWNATKGVGESALALGSGALKAINLAANDILPGTEGRTAMREQIEADPVLNYRGGPEAAPILNTIGMVTKPVSRAVDFAHGA